VMGTVTGHFLFPHLSHLRSTDSHIRFARLLGRNWSQIVHELFRQESDSIML
jgi:hypothetical protein